jgi:hypothetical protein
MAVTSSGDGNFSSVITGGLSVNDDVIINHDVTMDGHAPNVNSLVINSGKTLTGGGYKITIDGENSSGFAVDNDGIISGNLDLEINTQASTTCDFNGTSGNFQNVKLNHASVDATFHTDTTFDGTLIIAAGTLKPQGGSTITVGGDTTVTGTFGVASGSGAHSFGSLTINSGGTHIATSGTTEITSAASNYAISNAGTFTHNDGTVTITGGSNQWLHNGPYYNLISNNDSSIGMGIGANITVANDLTVNASKNVGWVSAGNTLTVTGDVIVNGYLNKYNSSTVTADLSFGSLTIASGGTYYATSGTTTITGDPGGYPNFGINIDGTFTHNNGTLKYTGGGGAFDLSGTGNLYNFEHAPTATTFITTNTTIENNLTMTGANFQGANGNENLTVKGNVTINSSAKSLTFVGTSEHTFGFLTILDGTYKVQNDTGGFTKVGGIRNVGGTVSNAV